MTDPNDMTALQAVLAGSEKDLAILTESRRAASKTMAHLEWESKEEMTAQLAVYKAKLVILEAESLSKRRAAQAEIECHIDECHRMLNWLQEGRSVALGNISGDKTWEDCEAWNDHLDEIKILQLGVEDTRDTLDNEYLWKE